MTTWGPKAASMPEEERERYLKSVRWELEQGHSSRVECMDGIIRRRWNLKDNTTRVEIMWRSIPAWLGDHFRRVASDAQVLEQAHPAP